MFGSKNQFMDRVYVHNLDCPWTKEDDGTIVIDMEHKGFFSTITQKGVDKSRVNHFSLDRNGSILWEAIDGEKTVSDLVNMIQDAFPEEGDMSERVVTFLRMLETNGLAFHRL